MKNLHLTVLILALSAISFGLFAANPQTTLVIEGVGNTASFIVDSEFLPSDKPIHIIAPAGFSVSPTTIAANATNIEVTVTLISYRAKSTGNIVLRSADERAYVAVRGIGSSLAIKKLSTKHAYTGGESTFEQTEKTGFTPGNNGYTVEFRVSAQSPSQEFYPYFVSGQNSGVQGYLNSKEFGFLCGSIQKPFSNPNSQLGRFYGEGKAHTYRYAVTPDNLVFVYRDGFILDTVRLSDFGPQPDFSTTAGELRENLLRNSDFEGAFEVIPTTNIAKKIEGWNIMTVDRWNAEQFIKSVEINDKLDMNNHILSINRYLWSDGWGAAEIVQVVNVAPNESYTLSALARGGIKNDGRILGKIMLQEMQNKELGTSVAITSNNWDTYSLDYTTSAACRQIRVIFYLERDKRGATISSLDLDNVKLTGREMRYTPKIGFINDGAKLDYFTYDLSGAYAPERPTIKISTLK